MQRHNTLRDALVDALKDHNIACAKEVPIGGCRRPADIALLSFDSRGSTAIDPVVNHPLCPGHNRTKDEARHSLKQAEEQKVRESEDLCHGNGWLFTPMGFHPWGGVGPYASAMLYKLEQQIAGDLLGWPKRKLIATFRSKLTFALMAFVA